MQWQLTNNMLLAFQILLVVVSLCLLPGYDNSQKADDSRRWAWLRCTGAFLVLVIAVVVQGFKQ